MDRDLRPRGMSLVLSADRNRHGTVSTADDARCRLSFDAKTAGYFFVRQRLHVVKLSLIRLE
jgi:hypothetical protein